MVDFSGSQWSDDATRERCGSALASLRTRDCISTGNLRVYDVRSAFTERVAELFKRVISTVQHWSLHSCEKNADVFIEFQYFSRRTGLTACTSLLIEREYMAREYPGSTRVVATTRSCGGAGELPRLHHDEKCDGQDQYCARETQLEADDSDLLRRLFGLIVGVVAPFGTAPFHGWPRPTTPRRRAGRS